MPVLSAFYGIIVRMQCEKGGKHHVPHIHAIYETFELVADLDGNVLEGEFPPNKLKLLEAWIVLHHEDLRANWNLLYHGDMFYRIEPLR